MLSRDWKELLASFARHEVRYLVVGGHAVAVHGHPRYTKDLDLWVDATPENARRLVRALTEFGFGDLGLGEGDFTESGTVVQLGQPPQRVDLLTSLSGVSFADCEARKVVTVIDGCAVPVIGLADLIRNKRATGRHSDLADVEALDTD